MDRGVCKLTGAFVGAVKPGDDPAVFCFSVIGVHASQGRNCQTAVGFNLGYHSTQSIYMGFQKYGVVRVFSAKICKDASFYCPFRGIS